MSESEAERSSVAADQPDRPTSTMRAPAAVERHRAHEQTIAYRFRVFVGHFADRALVITGLSLVLLPLYILGVLALDLPFTWFDGWAAPDGLKPSAWMSRGDIAFIISVCAMIIMTRRYGARLVGQAQGASWLALTGVSALMLLYLAPQLTAADFPSGRYVIGFVVSWYVAGQIAIYLYQMTRGGRWWRAPLLGAMVGLISQSLIFFPIAMSASISAWPLLFVADLTLKAVIAAVFLGVYRLTRRRVRPRPGLGGR